MPTCSYDEAASCVMWSPFAGFPQSQWGSQQERLQIIPVSSSCFYSRETYYRPKDFVLHSTPVGPHFVEHICLQQLTPAPPSPPALHRTILTLASPYAPQYPSETLAGPPAFPRAHVGRPVKLLPCSTTMFSQDWETDFELLQAVTPWTDFCSTFWRLPCSESWFLNLGFWIVVCESWFPALIPFQFLPFLGLFHIMRLALKFPLRWNPFLQPCNLFIQSRGNWIELSVYCLDALPGTYGEFTADIFFFMP